MRRNKECALREQNEGEQIVMSLDRAGVKAGTRVQPEVGNQIKNNSSRECLNDFNYSPDEESFEMILSNKTVNGLNSLTFVKE